MMSPLNKRFPRELRNNLGKYLGIFALMAVAISLTTGFLVAASSIEATLDKVRDDYTVEDGRFTANFEVADDVLEKVEDLGVKVYPNFSRDLSLMLPESAASKDGEQVLRVYANREKVDLASYYEGHAPKKKDEVALDRLYAANHGLKLGDALELDGETFTVCGTLALSDYQALFEKNSDFVFNAQTFSVGLVSEKGFDAFDADSLSYTYSFVCDDRGMSDADRSELEEDMADVLSDENVALSDFVDADANSAIGYAADDVEGDQVMWQVMLWMIIVIMAFVFVILTSSTIESESSVIGTLRASGYRKGELVRHYLALPMIVGAAGALVGNVLGYTLLSDPMKDLYCNSYSLPPYEAVFNPRVFVSTTIVPLVLLFVVTLIGLMRKLSCTPLQFLRHETSRKGRRGGHALPGFLGFKARFRLRVIGRNLGNFVTLFFGVTFATLLLIFGLCIMPCVENYANDLRQGLVSDHLYTLKAPLELTGTDAEREAWAAADELSKKVDMSAIDEDAMGDKLADIVSKRAKDRVEDALEDAFDADALAKEILKKQGKGSIAGIDVAKLMKADADDPFADIDTDDIDIAELGRLGILTTTKVDLTDCGLGVVDMATFDEDAVDEDSLDLSAVDFSGISKSDVGLAGVDLDGMTLKEFFELADKASDVPDDDDAHPVNTVKISKKKVKQAEKLAIATLSIPRPSGSGSEDISVYGIATDSRYWDEVDVTKGKVVIGNGLADKYGITVGESFTLDDRYENESHDFTANSTWGSMGNMYVYMSLDAFNELFDNRADYFNAYASDAKLKLDATYVVNDLTPSDMDKIVDQMRDSMGGMGDMLMVVGVLIFIILIYLLTKTVIDHSARAISYLKVFGYRGREVNSIYLRSITITVVFSLMACLPLVFWILSMVVKVAFADYSGNFVISIGWEYLTADVALGLVSYAVVAVLHLRRIRRVPLSLALKVQE